MVRKLAVLAALGLMILPVFAAQSKNSAAIRAMNAGKEHLRRDEFGMAIKSFTKYASLEPENSDPYELRACTYLKMDSSDLALNDIAKLQQIDSDEQTGFLANWLKGIVLLRRGDAAGADTALVKASSGSPSVAGQRIARARQSTESIFVGLSAAEQTSEEYRLKLADLLLDECIDYKLLGFQR